MSKAKFELQPGEVIESDRLANHFKGYEAVGGRLYLTNQRLVFKSHSFNLQNHTESWDYRDITKLEFCNTLLLVPNGLRIYLVDGSREQFVVYRRRKLRRLIEEKMKG